MAQPLYGVDGNLLVEDLPHPREVVEAILDGRFKPTYWAQQMLPMHPYTTYYPQLADERRKRAHRKTYRAHLEALQCLQPGGGVQQRPRRIPLRPGRVSDSLS